MSEFGKKMTAIEAKEGPRLADVRKNFTEKKWPIILDIKRRFNWRRSPPSLPAWAFEILLRRDWNWFCRYCRRYLYETWRPVCRRIGQLYRLAIYSRSRQLRRRRAKKSKNDESAGRLFSEAAKLRSSGIRHFCAQPNESESDVGRTRSKQKIDRFKITKRFATIILKIFKTP